MSRILIIAEHEGGSSTRLPPSAYPRARSGGAIAVAILAATCRPWPRRRRAIAGVAQVIAGRTPRNDNPMRPPLRRRSQPWRRTSRMFSGPPRRSART